MMSAKQSKFPLIKTAQVADLIPYARNSRTHSDEQITQIAASIKEFGFLNPVIVDGENGIIAGHGRVMAAKKLGMTELPVVEASHLTDAQRRAYIIADNKLALNAGWNDEMLRVEFDELQAMDFDLELTGFTAEEIGSFDFSMQSEKESNESNYSTNIESPIYEIKGEKPAICELYDTIKTGELYSNIMKVDLPDDVRGFLMAAATRHTVFNYENIAEFYAHQDSEVQELMRQSALVIIDFEQAIENGFVKLSKNIEQIRQEELYEDDDEQ
jgi:hypothetical protein